jgi:hypothetical protein
MYYLLRNECRGQENVGLYIHSPIRLHGVVLKSVKLRDNFTFTFTFIISFQFPLIFPYNP